jgi:hypothetical protein
MAICDLPTRALQETFMKTTSSTPRHKSADFATTKPPPQPDSNAPLNKEDFARNWGFASFLELFEASQPVGDAGGKKKWLITALRGGKWLLWNEGQMEAARQFDSREDALPAVPRETKMGSSEAAKIQG